jgi:hypothetical protein
MVVVIIVVVVIALRGAGGGEPSLDFPPAKMKNKSSKRSKP